MSMAICAFKSYIRNAIGGIVRQFNLYFFGLLNFQVGKSCVIVATDLKLELDIRQNITFMHVHVSVKSNILKCPNFFTDAWKYDSVDFVTIT